MSAAARRVLVAGIGNIFLGDDGFGVEVVRRIDADALPASVDVADYGIRGIHLAYDLLDGRHDTLIMVDAVPLDGPPGTLAVLDAGQSTGTPSAGPGPGRGRAGEPAGDAPATPAAPMTPGAPAAGTADDAPAGPAAAPAAAAPAAAAPAAEAPGGRAVAGATPVPAAMDGHGLHPQAVLALLNGLGGRIDRVLVVGCRPADVGERMGLSEPVGAAVDDAVRIVTALAEEEASGGNAAGVLATERERTGA